MSKIDQNLPLPPSSLLRPPLVFRCDSTPQIGTGHVMRCIALGQAWQDAGGRAVFLMATEAPVLKSRLHSEGMEVVHLPVHPGSTDDAIQTADFAHQVGAGWVVVDGYHFGADYQRTIKDSGLRLLFIDDNGHAGHYSADLVLNQNIHAHEGLYPNREPYTRLLLGTRYVLLRREFLKWRGWKREIPEVACKVLVTMGGSDPNNVTLKVIQALQQVDIDGLEAIVVVGGSNPHYGELQSAVQDSRFPIRLESNVTNMPELMACAEMAVIAAGGTVWELLFMGCPVVSYARNGLQHEILSKLNGTNAVSYQGYTSQMDETELALSVARMACSKAEREQKSLAGRLIVDGNGAKRVLNELISNAESNVIWTAT